MAAIPHSLGHQVVAQTKTPAQRKVEGGWSARHGTYPKGTVLPETMKLECPRVKVADLPEGFLRKNHIEALEQNQLIASCCRHPENHEVEAFKSHSEETAPDIYVFHCDKCDRKHRFFCVGTGDRPFWKVG